MVTDGTRCALEGNLTEAVGRPVTLTFTDNVYSMASFREDGRGGLVVRLHHIFGSAPPPVLADLIGWLRDPGAEAPEVRAFMKARRGEVRPATPRRAPPLNPHGHYHNLDTAFARINAAYFESQLEMRITWGPRPRKRFPRTVVLGSYCQETGVITISARLDRRHVPRYFLEYVVYHEMLHAALGIEEGENGRRRIHTREFQRLERLYQDYDRALAFQKHHFG